MHLLSLATFAFVGIVSVVVVEGAKPIPQAVSPYDGCTIVSLTSTPAAQAELNAIAHGGGNPLVLLDSDSTHFSCVDARTQHDTVNTPAGDIGEFMTALDVFRRMCPASYKNNTITELNDMVVKMMKSFVDAHATSMRPFYMHTDNTSLAGLLTAMGVDSLPETLTAAEQIPWYTKLLQNVVRYHGCGHMWYQVAFPDQYETDINMVYATLRAFFTLLWDPTYSDRIMYEVVFGALNGKAVVEVLMDETTPSPTSKGSRRVLRGRNTAAKATTCDDKVFPISPRYCPQGCPQTDAKLFSLSANQEISPELDVFALHVTAVHRHRTYTLVPFFYPYCNTKSVTYEAFFKEVMATSTRQTNVTLEHVKALPDEVPYFTIKVGVTPEP